MNKKGFTLVELIAVVTIIGIIALIAIPSIMTLSNNSKKEQVISDAKKLISDVKRKSKLIEYEEYYPDKVEGSCKKICIKESKFNGVIVNDPDGNKYDEEESCVNVLYQNGKYNYFVKLASKYNGKYKRGISTSKSKILYVLETHLNKDTSVRYNNSVEIVNLDGQCPKLEDFPEVETPDVPETDVGQEGETELVYTEDIQSNVSVNLVTEDGKIKQTETTITGDLFVQVGSRLCSESEPVYDSSIQNYVLKNTFYKDSTLLDGYYCEGCKKSINATPGICYFNKYDLRANFDYDVYEGGILYSMENNSTMKYVSSEYTFDEKTGMYTLTSATKGLYGNQISKYTCDSETNSKCIKMYRIVETTGNIITKADIYTSKQ